MKIGVVADTHMPRCGRSLPLPLVQGLQGVDLILHLGDVTTWEVVAQFEAIAPFDAVAGNNDPPELWERFGRKKVLTAAGMRIGLIHGDGFRSTTRERAIRAFENEAVAMVLYGHSHSPDCSREGDLWVVNPGSPTDKRRQPHFSFALVTLHNGRIEPRLHVF